MDRVRTRNEKRDIKVGLSVASILKEVQNAVIPSFCSPQSVLAEREKNETFTRPFAVNAACKLKPTRPLAQGRYLNDVHSGWGGTRKADESTDMLRECDSDKGGDGVKKSGNFVDVIKVRPLRESRWSVVHALRYAVILSSGVEGHLSKGSESNVFCSIPIIYMHN